MRTQGGEFDEAKPQRGRAQVGEPQVRGVALKARSA